MEMVLVGDDCSLPGQGIAGRRGIAGLIMVSKVLGLFLIISSTVHLALVAA